MTVNSKSKLSKQVSKGKAKAKPKTKPKAAPLSKSKKIRVMADALTEKVKIRTKGVWNVATANGATVKFAVAINPTDPRVVGQAAKVISSYESWRILSATLHYEPTCAATQAGSIAIRVDPDANDSIPPNFEDFISTGLVAYGPQWQALDLPIRKEYINKLTSYYVDPVNGAGSHTMSRLSCPGQIQFFTTADTAAVSIGVVTLRMVLECSVLSEILPGAILSVTDSAPNGDGGNWISSSAAVKIAGAAGVFSSVLHSDAPGGKVHVEALKPGIYECFVQWVGTGLGTGSLAAITGETVSGITFTVNQAVTNAASTVATLAATIVVAKNFYTQFNGKTYTSFLDILPTLSGLATLTSATMNLNYKGG